jgi:predicted nucleic acid-binding protein
VLLLDNSAWARLPEESSRGTARARSEWIDRDEIAVCLPFLLEAGYSACSAADRKALMARLDQLPRVAIDSNVERVALQAQRVLAEIGHHRLAPPGSL